MNFWHLLISGLAMQGFTLSLALIFQPSKKKKRQNLLLALILFLYSLSLIEGIFLWTGWYREYPHILAVSYLFPLLYGPLFYLFTSGSLGSRIILKKEIGWHLLPFVLAFIYLIPFYMGSGDEKLDFASWYGDWIKIFGIQIFKMVSLIFYGFLVRRELLLNSRHISLPGNHWLKRMLFCYWGFVVLFCVNYLLIVLGIVFPAQDYLIAIGSAVFISGFAYLTLMASPLIIEPVVRVKYSTSSIDLKTSAHLFEKLEFLMRAEKPYLKPTIKLSELSGMLNVTPNQLSQTINQNSGKNFGEYLNSYRIKEAYSFLQNSTDSILDIAFKAGFNNKTTFYKCFKDTFGISPSQVHRSEIFKEFE